MDEFHLLREAQQIKLLSEKIKKTIATDYETKSMDGMYSKIEDIENINTDTKNFLEKVSKNNTISDELLTKINHELRTPLVPILAYVEMLLDPRSGSLSDDQRKRLEAIRSSTKALAQSIPELFSEKNWDVISDKPKKNNQT